jgi:acyl carrier protein
MDIAQRVREFIVTNFYVTDEAHLAADVSLIRRGIVDSTGMLEVIGFLEEEFGLSIADDEMTPENLETIGRIAAFVARKTRAGAA